MVGFLASVAILFSVVIFCVRYDWKSSRKDRARISFIRFMDLYSKKPQAWTFYDDCVMFSSYPGDYLIEFESYLDVLKYRRFRKKVAKERLKERQESNQEDFEEELNKSYEEVKE